MPLQRLVVVAQMLLQPADQPEVRYKPLCNMNLSVSTSAGWHAGADSFSAPLHFLHA